LLLIILSTYFYIYCIVDECVTTKPYEGAVTYFCPDKCPRMGVKFQGNIADPYNKQHYIACWNGLTVGCINCPANLEFSEEENACLYSGIYLTESYFVWKYKKKKNEKKEILMRINHFMQIICDNEFHFSSCFSVVFLLW